MPRIIKIQIEGQSYLGQVGHSDGISGAFLDAAQFCQANHSQDSYYRNNNQYFNQGKSFGYNIF